eukprot:31530-Pelagococcus_subviridis.AAC.3
MVRAVSAKRRKRAENDPWCNGKIGRNGTTVARWTTRYGDQSRDRARTRASRTLIGRRATRCSFTCTANTRFLALHRSILTGDLDRGFWSSGMIPPLGEPRRRFNPCLHSSVEVVGGSIPPSPL